MSAENRPGRYSLEEVVRLARETALAHGGHVPTLIAEGDRGTVVGQLQELPDTHAERRQAMFAAGMRVAHEAAIGALKHVYFISEGWMAQAQRDGTMVMPPSQDPNRIEVLFISGLDVRSGQIELTLFEMVRDNDGRLVDLKQMAQPQIEDSYADSPLLAAFVDGFGMGRRTKLN